MSNGLSDYPGDNFDAIEKKLRSIFGEKFGYLSNQHFRETLNAFYLSVVGMERNLLDVAFNQLFDQILSGSETIDNPLNSDFFQGLGYLEAYAPNLVQYFTDIFGENDSLDRSEIFTTFDIEPVDQIEPPSQKEITRNGDLITDKQGNFVRYVYNGVNYVRDEDGNLIPEETAQQQQEFSEYQEAVLEAVTVVDQEQADKENLWETQILPALEAGGDFVKTAIFGPSPSGGPKTIEEMFEEYMEATLDSMKGPLTVTVDPQRGLLAEILIPVNLSVNGAPLEIKIFDEDGNFVGTEQIAEAVWSAAEEKWGVIEEGIFRPIEDIFTGEEGTVVERIFDAAESVIATVGSGGVVEEGWWTSTIGDILGEGLFTYDSATNTIEEGQEVGTGDLSGDDAFGDTTQEGDDELPLTEEEEYDDDVTDPFSKPPPGRAVTDKDGNILGIDGFDGKFYVQDADGNWVEQARGEDDGVDQFTETTVEATVDEADTGEDTTDPVDADDTETDAYSGMFDNVPQDTVRSDDEINDLIDTALEDYVKTADLPEDQVRTDDEINDLIDVALAAIPDDAVRTDDEIQDLINTALEDYVKTEDLPEDQVRTDDEINELIGTALEDYVKTEDLPEDQVRTDDEIQDLINTTLEDYVKTEDLPEDQVRTDDEIQDLIDVALAAIPEDTVRSDDEINDLITTALDNLDLPEDTTRSDEEIQDLIDSSISAFTTTDQVTDIVNNVLVESGLTTLNDLSKEEVTSIVTNIVGAPASDTDPATGLYATIDNLNNISVDDVTNIVTTALGGLENISQEDVSNIVTDIVGTTEATLTGQISTLDTDLNNRIDALVEAGVERADAVDQALSDLAIANQTSEEAILAQIGTTEAALTGQITELGEDITGVGADVEALAQTVGQDTQYDDAGNVVSEATGVFAEFDNLIEQGANEYQALTTAISNVSDQVGTTETTLFGAIADSENRLSDIIGSPSMSDDPNTPEDESVLATGIYADIEQSASDVSSAVGSAIGGMGGGFEDFMGGIDYNLPQYVGVEYKPRKDYMIELDRLIKEGFESRQDIRQDSMFGDLIA
jgi:hypothetical protein